MTTWSKCDSYSLYPNNYLHFKRKGSRSGKEYMVMMIAIKTSRHQNCSRHTKIKLPISHKNVHICEDEEDIERINIQGKDSVNQGSKITTSIRS